MTTDHLLDLQWQDSEIETGTERIIGWTGSEDPWPPGQNIFEVITGSPFPDEIPAPSGVAPTFSAHSSSQDVALRSAITFEIFQSPTSIIHSHHPLLDQTFNTYDMDTRPDEPPEQDLPSGAIDPTDDYIDERQIQKRKLRPQTSRAGFMSTWIDHDETGNYDPNEELRQRRARIWRRRPRTHSEEDEHVSPGSKEDENTIKTALLSVANSLEVKLHFASNAGKSAFRDHVKRSSAAPRQEPQDFARGKRLRDCGRDRFTHQDAGKANNDSVTMRQQTVKPHTAAAARKRKAGTKPADENSAVKQQKNSATGNPHGATKRIVSRFSHPIQFNAEDANGSTPCSFCEHTSFQIIGLEAKEHDVIEWQDGRGYNEIGGGHREDGVEPTRVCTACTMRRLLIIMCEKHQMRLIPGLSPETMDVEGAINSLFSGALRQQDRWCSVCPSLASYECKATSSVDLLGHECQGCGLSLCETCMLNPADRYKGDLQQMLSVLKDEPSHERPLGLRADWNLLKQDGLLMRHVLLANA
ncbi:hypothetical protein KC316_g3330 [Hortaea werneckii]|nr:hypothetical protein KC324_g3311 [Hortaea werneckii]KAI7590536.1 hypothetical protein KC316_g3330 [Hortaea werneckii]